ncbi:MAG TPA: class I SAM-dependent methyltransferase [Candidatus Binatia bacterium]
MIERFHNLVHRRRARVIAHALAAMIPENAEVLDVGSGDGLVAYSLKQFRAGVSIRGVDVVVRSSTYIPVATFDGHTLPYGDRTFDFVMFVDALHHTTDPMIFLREAARTARVGIIIKDHTLNGLLSGPTLRFMDWVGNARHHVPLPYNYWPKSKWLDAFKQLDLRLSLWEENLGLYPWPANRIFERSLHFLARLYV